MLALIWSFVVLFHTNERGECDWWDVTCWANKGFKAVWGATAGAAQKTAGVLDRIKDLIDGWLASLWSLLANGFRGGFDRIEGFSATIVAAAWNTAKGLFDRLDALGAIVVAGIWNGFKGLFDRVEGFTAAIVGALWNTAKGILDRIEGFASLIWGAIANAASGTFSRLEGLTSSLYSVLSQGFAGVFTRIEGFTSSLFTAIVNTATGIFGRLEGLTLSIIHIGDTVAGAVDTVGEKAIKSALNHKEEIAVGLIFGPTGLIIDELARQHPELGRKILESLTLGDKPAKEWAGDRFDELLHVITSGGHLEPEQAPAQLARALVVATEIGLIAHSLALVKDYVPTLDNTGTASVAGFLGKFSGWEHIIEAGLGASVALALRRPMEQHINTQTLTQLPLEGELGELFARRHTQGFDYTEALSRHGLKDTWRVVLQESAFRPVTMRELTRMMQTVDIPEDVLVGMLRDASYREEVIPQLSKALHGIARKAASGKLVSEAFVSRQKGYIDGAAFGAAMEAAGILSAEQGLWQLAAEAAYNNDVKNELVTTWRSAAARDAMSDDELRASLAMVGVSGARADIEVLRAQAARLKKPTNTVEKKHEKAVNAARATLTTAYKLQYHKGLINEQGLHDRLIVIGYEDFQAGAIVELSKVEKYVVPKVDAAASPQAVSARARKDLEEAYITQFHHDLIDAAALHSSLAAIGVNDFEASAIVAREQAKKIPSPVVFAEKTAARVATEVRSTLQAAYIEQFRKGLIGAGELEASLVQIGFDPAAAAAKTRLEEVKAITLPAAGAPSVEKRNARELRSAKKAAAVEEFRKGILTAGELDSAIIDAGYDAAVAAAVVETEQARAFKAPKPVAHP